MTGRLVKFPERTDPPAPQRKGPKRSPRRPRDPSIVTLYAVSRWSNHPKLWQRNATALPRTYRLLLPDTDAPADPFSSWRVIRKDDLEAKGMATTRRRALELYRDLCLGQVKARAEALQDASDRLSWVRGQLKGQ